MALLLRHLCFTGPERPPAKVEFGSGLNVIYGASDTGKSFVLEAIDFMLGGSGALRDIPERIGYDRVFLGVEAAGEGAFTLERATIGGEYKLYEGLHDAVPENVRPIVLGSKHNPKKTSNLSRFLLGKLTLDGKLVRTKKNETRTLSFRDLCHLCIVSETDIQKQGSPLETGQYINKVVEYSVFKLLLTGVDDGAVVATARDAAATQSRAAKLEVIDELIAGVQHRIAESGDSEEELTSQLERLQASITREQEALRVSEGDYQALLVRRNQLRIRFENGTERRAEIDELRARFELLDKHYQSDLARLEAMGEAGSLMAALAPNVCPLCGAAPEQQHCDSSCDGNMETIVAAADAESAKIVKLRRELAETMRQLLREAHIFDSLLPRLQNERALLDDRIQEFRPSLAERRSTYTELIEERAAVNASLAIFEHLADLQERKGALDQTPGGEEESISSTDLSSTTLDQFAQHVEQLLKAWNFPNADRVHFDSADRDLVIHGKKRGSRGKGLRAITHAGFTIGLMEFCKSQNRQHPGFVVLDSPLLAYREPEGSEDDLKGTDVQDKFYEYLAGIADRQVIIIENQTPPAAVTERPLTKLFSGNPHQGRYGYFPVHETTDPPG